MISDRLNWPGKKEKSPITNRLTSSLSTLNWIIVGTTGFEPATPCTPCKCATGLRYVPNPPLEGPQKYAKKAKSPNNPFNFFLTRPSKIFGSILALILYIVKIPSMKDIYSNGPHLPLSINQKTCPLQSDIPCGKPWFIAKSTNKSTERNEKNLTGSLVFSAN
jgi:hypothetical protein